jgi:hypothetical protein
MANAKFREETDAGIQGRDFFQSKQGLRETFPNSSPAFAGASVPLELLRSAWRF